MYISTLADPDLQKGGHISDKIFKLHPKNFSFSITCQKSFISSLSAKISDDLLYDLVIDHFFVILPPQCMEAKTNHFSPKLSSEIPVLIVFTPGLLLYSSFTSIFLSVEGSKLYCQDGCGGHGRINPLDPPLYLYLYVFMHAYMHALYLISKFI